MSKESYEADSNPTWGDVLSAGVSIRLYGRAMPSIELEAGRHRSVAEPAGKLTFVLVSGVLVNDICRRLPAPVLLALPGPGAAPPPGDTCARPGEKIWRVSPFDTTSALVPEHGTIDELLTEIEARSISGGLRLENPRIEQGKACVDVHVWAKIKVFGASVGFDERFPICIKLEGCKTVWEIGFARLEVCFEAPNRLCGKLCAGKWGIEKCWKECVTLPFAAERSASEAPVCKCGA